MTDDASAFSTLQIIFLIIFIVIVDNGMFSCLTAATVRFICWGHLIGVWSTCLRYEAELNLRGLALAKERAWTQWLPPSLIPRRCMQFKNGGDCARHRWRFECEGLPVFLMCDEYGWHVIWYKDASNGMVRTRSTLHSSRFFLLQCRYSWGGPRATLKAYICLSSSNVTVTWRCTVWQSDAMAIRCWTAPIRGNTCFGPKWVNTNSTTQLWNSPYLKELLSTFIGDWRFVPTMVEYSALLPIIVEQGRQ